VLEMKQMHSLWDAILLNRARPAQVQISITGEREMDAPNRSRVDVGARTVTGATD
jgi:hypothetical protein